MKKILLQTAVVINIFIGLVIFSSHEQVQAAAALIVKQISPSTSIRTGDNLSFTVDSPGLILPTFTISDNFVGSSVSANDINSRGLFSWTPRNTDTGTHTFTISALDVFGFSATTTQVIQVIGASSTIIGLPDNSTVIVGYPLNFSVKTENLFSPMYSIQDSFPGSSATSKNIDTSGRFSWTPTMSDIGTHVISVIAYNSMGHQAVTPVTINVLGPTVTIGTTTPGTTVGVNQILTFPVTSMGFYEPRFRVSDSFFGSSVSTANLDSTGKFTWSPGIFQIGSHTISVNAYDVFGRSATSSVVITVDQNSVFAISLTPPSPNSRTAVGTGVSFQVQAYGFTPTTYTITDSFSGSSISSTTINYAGKFYWVPTSKDVGTHEITVTASDGLGKSGTAKNTIVVTQDAVTPIIPVSSVTTQSIAIGQTNTGLGSPGSTNLTLTLQLGSKNNEVSILQGKLKALGVYSGAINGTFGPMTQAAVRKFQSQNGISSTGVVGPITRKALNK